VCVVDISIRVEGQFIAITLLADFVQRGRNPSPSASDSALIPGMRPLDMRAEIKEKKLLNQ
jgi:hypothetical protein